MLGIAFSERSRRDEVRGPTARFDQKHARGARIEWMVIYETLLLLPDSAVSIFDARNPRLLLLTLRSYLFTKLGLLAGRNQLFRLHAISLDGFGGVFFEKQVLPVHGGDGFGADIFYQDRSREDD